MRSLKVAVVSALLLIGSAEANWHGQMRGRIIAFRPAERITQYPSFVENSEAFLLQTEGRNPAVVKLLYRHMGYSDLGEAVLDGSETLAAQVQREIGCDETFGEFLRNSPVIRVGGSSTGGTEPLVFVGLGTGMKLSMQQELKCYRVAAKGRRVQ